MSDNYDACACHLMEFGEKCVVRVVCRQLLVNGLQQYADMMVSIAERCQHLLTVEEADFIRSHCC